MKIFATDYDGTLRMGNGISEDNIRAIEKFRSEGNLFGVVTGRDYTNGYKIFKRSNEFPFDFLILSNGANAYDFDGNELFCFRTDAKAALEGKNLAAALMEKSFELKVEYCGLFDGKTRYIFCPDLPKGGEYEGVVCSPFSVLFDIDSFISGFAVFTDDGKCSCAVQQFYGSFGEYIEAIQNGRSLDFTPKGITKASGLQTLAEYYGVKKEDVFVSGDNFNDISMLRAYNGFAMTSGVDEAKKCANYVCDSVAKAIEIALKS